MTKNERAKLNQAREERLQAKQALADAYNMSKGFEVKPKSIKLAPTKGFNRKQRRDGTEARWLAEQAKKAEKK